MLIYDRFVFLHMPKTAGIFLTDALQDEFGPPGAVLETHAGWDEIPPESVGRPVLMYVRNPWDWYVSWYHFWTRSWLPRQDPSLVRSNPWLRLLLGDDIEVVDGELRGVNDFGTTVRSACENLHPSHPAMEQMIEDGVPYAASTEAGDDFYTATFERLAGAGLGSGLLTIGRFETLFDDLERFFEKHGIPLGERAVERIAARPPVNVNDHRPYREYYDDELRDLVGRCCRTIVETYDYRF